MAGFLTFFEGLAFLVWGSGTYSLTPFSGQKPLHFGGLYIPTQGLWVVGTAMVLVVALWWMLTRTATGKALRACAGNAAAARLMGIPVDRLIMLAFAASGALGAIAGAMFVPLTSLDFSGMANYTNQGLIAVTLGGLGNFFGSIVGGFVSNWLKALHVHVDILQIAFAVTMLTIGALRIVSILRARESKSASHPPESSPSPGSAATNGKPSQPEKVSGPVFLRSFTDRRGVQFDYTARMFPGMLIGFVGGFIGAMLGLGGGVIYVPILTALIGLPAGIATATSTFTILFANPFAVIVRFASIRWDLVLFLSIGVVISASIVPRFLHRVRAKWLLAGFWTLAILASVRLLLKVAGVNL